MLSLGIVSGKAEVHSLIIDKYALEKYLKRRELLANLVQLAASDFEDAIKILKKHEEEENEYYEWFKEQYKSFKKQVSSCMEAAQYIV